MNKHVKEGLIFAGGFMCCGVLTTAVAIKVAKKMLTSKMITDSAKQIITDKIRTAIFEEHPSEKYSKYYGVEDVLFESRLEAELVLDQLEEIISIYGMASVADFYDLCSLELPDFDVARKGWTNLSHARIVRKRSGYVLELPKPYNIRK